MQMRQTFIFFMPHGCFISFIYSLHFDSPFHYKNVFLLKNACNSTMMTTMTTIDIDNNDYGDDDNNNDGDGAGR